MEGKEEIAELLANLEKDDGELSELRKMQGEVEERIKRTKEILLTKAPSLRSLIFHRPGGRPPRKEVPENVVVAFPKQPAIRPSTYGQQGNHTLLILKALGRSATAAQLADYLKIGREAASQRLAKAYRLGQVDKIPVPGPHFHGDPHIRYVLKKGVLED